MQYGAKQVFGEIKEYLKDAPETNVILSPTWSNGTDTLLLFFLPDEPRVSLGNIDLFAASKVEMNDRMLFVMTANEYDRAREDPKFTDIRVEKTLKYPNGENGFYFVRLRYVSNVDAVFAAEAEERRRPVQEDVTIDGETVTTLHSRFNEGQVSNMFDGDVYTLARTADANPAVIDIIFPQPRALSGVTVTTGSMDVALTVRLFDSQDAELGVYSRTYKDLPGDPTVELPFDGGPVRAKKIRLEVKNANAPELTQIHVREIVLR